MDQVELEAFVTLAEERHFGRAAARLLVSTATVSRRIRDLERTVGTALFERTSRRVALTSSGELLLGPATRALAGLRAFTDEARDVVSGRRGVLRAVYAGSHGATMATLVRRLRADVPGIDVVLSQGTSQTTAVAVRDGKADIGIGRPIGVGMARHLISSEPLDCIVMARGHRLAALDVVVPEDLAGETIVRPDPEIVPPMGGLDDWPAKGSPIHVRHERVTTEGEFLDRVAAGYGVVVATSSLLLRNPRPDLAARPYVGPPPGPPVEAHLLWRQDDPNPLVRLAVTVARSLWP